MQKQKMHKWPELPDSSHPKNREELIQLNRVRSQRIRSGYDLPENDSVKEVRFL